MKWLEDYFALVQFFVICSLSINYWGAISPLLPEPGRLAARRVSDPNARFSLHIEILCKISPTIKSQRTIKLPLIENVESWMFRWPSGLAPLQEGVLTAESGSVGVGQTFSSIWTWNELNSNNTPHTTHIFIINYMENKTDTFVANITNIDYALSPSTVSHT